MSASPVSSPTTQAFDDETIAALWALATRWRRCAGRQPSPAHYAAVIAATLGSEAGGVAGGTVSL